MKTINYITENKNKFDSAARSFFEKYNIEIKQAEEIENKNFTKKDSYWLDPAKWLKSKED
jgi:predicted RNA binding protein with dsRBD fold (UPF0201 family)